MANGRLSKLTRPESTIVRSILDPAQQSAVARRESKEPQLSGLTEEELNVLVPMAEAILSNSRTDAEANELFLSAKGRLQSDPETASIRLPSNIGREQLKQFVAAGKASGIRSPGVVSSLTPSKPTVSGGGTVIEENITALPELDKPVREGLAEAPEPSGDIERERRVIRRQLNLLNKFGGDNKKRSDLLLRLGEIEEELGVEVDSEDTSVTLPKTPEEIKIETAEKAERGKLRAKRDDQLIKSVREERGPIDSLKRNAELFRSGIIKLGFTGPGLETPFKVGSTDLGKPLTELFKQLGGFTVEQRAGEDQLDQAGNAIAISFKKELPGVLSDSDILLLKSLAPSKTKTLKANTIALRLIDATVIMSEIRDQFFEDFRSQKGALTTDNQSAEQIFNSFKEAQDFGKLAEEGPGVSPLAINKEELRSELYQKAGLKP